MALEEINMIGMEHIGYHKSSGSYSRGDEPIIVDEKGLGTRLDNGEKEGIGNYLKYAALIKYGPDVYNVRISDHDSQGNFSQGEVYLFWRPVERPEAEKAYEALDEDPQFHI